MSKPSWSLKDVPSDVILPILMKMHNIELCRMRRTCSLMNNTAQENQQKLSKRNMFYTRVSFTKDKFERNIHFPDHDRQEEHREKYSFDQIDLLKSQLSGISIKLLGIYGIHNYKIRGKMQAFMEELNPNVDTLYIEDFPPRAASALLEKVNFRTGCVVRMMIGSNQPSTTKFMKTMAESPRHSKIGLHIRDDRINDEHFQLFKDFREIQFGHTALLSAHYPHLWIQKLSALDDVGHLKRVSFHWQRIEYENLQKMWTVEAYHFDIVNCCAPRFVAQVEMQNNIMFIMPFSQPRWTSDTMILVFVSKASDKKYLDVLESLEDISPIIHEGMPKIRRKMESASDEQEQADFFLTVLDDLVKEGGFFNIYPWISEYVCFKRWH